MAGRTESRGWPVVGGGRKSQRCPHDETISIQTSGMEQVVCERCGEVNVRYLSELSGSVDRARFARDADRPPRHLAETEESEGSEEAEEKARSEDFAPINRARVGWPLDLRSR
jgi:hypothetical protein